MATSKPGVITVKQVEIALSVVLAEWFIEHHPDTDIETTRLEEMGGNEAGIMLTVGDNEFEVVVQQIR